MVEKWVADGVLKVIKPSREPTKEDKKSPYYCHYHQYVHHKTRDCRWNPRLNPSTGGPAEPTAIAQQRKGYSGSSNSCRNIKDDVSDNKELPPVAVSALQRSLAFCALYNQVGFNEEERKVATEALVSIASDSDIYCLTTKAHASRPF